VDFAQEEIALQVICVMSIPHHLLEESAKQ